MVMVVFTVIAWSETSDTAISLTETDGSCIGGSMQPAMKIKMAKSSKMPVRR
jgi:predicted metal-binding membrane protein